MSALPMLDFNGVRFVNPLQPLNDALQTWNDIWEALASQLLPKARVSIVSAKDLANERIKMMQWLLYEGYVERRKLKPLQNERRQCNRFIHWSGRHSSNFRKLLDLYPEWLAQFDDPHHDRAKLMRTIAFHLYQ